MKKLSLLFSTLAFLTVGTVAAQAQDYNYEYDYEYKVEVYERTNTDCLGLSCDLYDNNTFILEQNRDEAADVYVDYKECSAEQAGEECEMYYEEEYKYEYDYEYEYNEEEVEEDTIKGAF